MSSKVDAGFEIKDPDPEILPVLPSSHRDGGIRREIDSNDNCDEKPTISAPELKPVPFMSLFRFATKLEVALNAVGLVAAAASGSALPLMSLLFGNLVQAFVTFGTVLALAQMGDTNAQEELPIAAARFRHVSALDASYLVYMGLGSFVCTFLYMYTWSYTGEVNAMRLRERYLEAILRQDVAYFDNVGAGEVTTRIRTDTHLVQQGTSEKVALSASFVSSFFTGMILAYIRSWRLALALSSMIPAIAIAGAFMNYFISRYKQISLKYSAAAGSIAEEVISTVRTAHAFGTQETLADVYDGPIDKSRAISLKSAIWQGGGMAVLLFVIYSGYALAFSFGTTLINKGEITPGAVVNVFDAILVGSFSLALLAPELQAITHAQGAAAKLYETIDRVPIIDSYSEAGLKPDTCVGEITLEDIQFNYPSRPDVPILNNLSITFPAGTTVALVGASGSGKSTVISLVERFYDPLAGAIKLDGIDLRELNIRWLRSQIGLVSQEPTLFSTTVKDNVAYGLIGTKWEQASDDKKMTLIKEACVKANADTFISKLPLGYDSLVGERGLQLSGGQKQRIAIARAIVSDPRILLLDEATSALDTQSEDVVQDALDKAAAGRTTITIAHRLSTIKDADCIYVMGDGQVLESGTHRQLLLDETGPYSLLVEAQKLRETDTEQADTMETTDSIRNPEDIASEGFADEPKGETPPGRIQTNRPLGSKLRPMREDSSLKPQYSLPYLFKRMGAINRDNWLRYLIGGVAACLNGAVYPAFGIVFGNSINSFSEPDPRQRRHDGDRNALW
ncbi:hypothetical protein PHLCEN_2v4394 [Hermanssonia centrifuga]|uniref:Uncharacterized protein n=1 Tax=Hermanssonia centrifuga TaxID=98765 RepID=A0A2R6PNP8_9APHY|nr:hypothetical protein PHLCEN_2v4394 [Hermanssonia centrifuga]